MSKLAHAMMHVVSADQRLRVESSNIGNMLCLLPAQMQVFEGTTVHLVFNLRSGHRNSQL